MQLSNIKKSIFIIIIAILIIIILKYLAIYNEEKLWPKYKEYREIKIGMTQNEVENMLGQPYKVYYKDNAPKNYYIEGWNYKKRNINNKVYIYLEGEPIAYIYFDNDDKVEYVFVGGS